MALTDPQVITVAAVAKSMPRINSSSSNGQTVTKYNMSDLTYFLTVSHRNVKRSGKARVISQVVFMKRAVVADPLTAVNDWDSVQWSVQLDRPEAGFTSTEIGDMLGGLKTWYDSTMVGKIIGGES